MGMTGNSKTKTKLNTKELNTTLTNAVLVIITIQTIDQKMLSYVFPFLILKVLF